MGTDIRAATTGDVPAIAHLLLRNAEVRADRDDQLWRLAEDGRGQAAEAVNHALTAEKQPFRQAWLVAADRGAVLGLIHTIRLPVPPIYAGRWGQPGLIMPDSTVVDSAPAGLIADLVDAAETDLRDDAGVLLAAHAGDAAWQSAFEAKGYAPLTLYLSKPLLPVDAGAGAVRPARENDIPEIVALSATNRRVLHDLDAFWEPHAEADLRFANWMRTSLTLQDRDMLVSRAGAKVDGYIIAQPASRLHFPAAHDISGIGVIDDWFHEDFADPADLPGNAECAAELLGAGEAALRKRGKDIAFVVCPAAWRSKLSLLEAAGYRTALTWMIRN